ncbi:nitrous oxidase accessory protein [Halococcus thailandensis JCM 13552]|uniref:Nitrous oxidase accessory protein n=1 Tax=Halococcus thailandensis JCM 13552 TaxID=1227457 RepID=M0NG48_9EURY|nr:NosD domain-containing protein [Halococcus thailandensis]EMA56059.1 nitrous oxidase accessory protein [Halococcus thailandensis JCM 13552]
MILLFSSVSFALTPTNGEDLQPVPFDDTVGGSSGGGVDVRQAEEEGFVLPRTEVFFSNYRYVVGDYGIGETASKLTNPGTERQFGTPLAIYVSDFSTVKPTLSEEGFVVSENGQTVGWTTATNASFVVNSEARVPSGSTVLPFSNRADAKRFIQAHGGRIVEWDALGETVDDPLQSRLNRFHNEMAARHTWANKTVVESRAILERPRSIVVGDDAPNISAAIAAAQPNTTVYLPPGTYETDDLTVNKSITLAGAGNETVLRGNGNRSVVSLRTDRIAVRNLRIDGVGDVGSRRLEMQNGSGNWTTKVRLAYGYGDAGIILDGADSSVISDVSIETNASGIINRKSNQSVIDNVTVYGAATSDDGFMGATVIGARSVVQDSTFVDGRDGVYTHRADGSVIRRNQLEGGRYGIHEMYTSHTLVANNTARNVGGGVLVMTGPTDNLVIGNDVRGSGFGIDPAGSDSFYANNVLVNNGYGMRATGQQNAYLDNIAVSNDIGIRAGEIAPSNWFIRNDVVDNDKQVESELGPLRTWTHRGIGNYWGDLPLVDADDNGIYDRGYQPTGTVDGRLGEVSGAITLAQSPASALLRRVRDVVSGIRNSGVIDTAPRSDPFHPEQIANARANRTRGDAA